MSINTLYGDSARHDKDIDFHDADEKWFDQMTVWWKSGLHKRFHIEDGFCIIASSNNQLLGCISVWTRQLPPPLTGIQESFIDFIEVREDYRQQGIARYLVELSEKRAAQNGSIQLRAWSNCTKIEAIPMWNALGFAMCPADPKDEGGPGYYVAKKLSKAECDKC